MPPLISILTQQGLKYTKEPRVGLELYFFAGLRRVFGPKQCADSVFRVYFVILAGCLFRFGIDWFYILRPSIYRFW